MNKKSFIEDKNNRLERLWIAKMLLVIVLLAGIIQILPVVNAETNLTEYLKFNNVSRNLIFYYTLDNNIYDATGHGFNLDSGIPAYSSSTNKYGYSLYNGWAYNISSDIWGDTNTNGTSNYTFCLWEYRATNAGGIGMFGIGNDSMNIADSKGASYFYVGGGKYYTWNTYNGAGGIQVNNNSIQNFVWNFWCLAKNYTNYTIYYNGAYNDTASNVWGNSSNDRFLIGAGNIAGSYGWIGGIDELGYWNSTLNYTDVAWLYNSGLGRKYAKVNLYNVQYTQNVSSGSIQTHYLNMSYDNLDYSGVSVALVYNSTRYTATTSDTGNYLTYTSNVNVPSSSSVSNYSFYWEVTLTNSSETYTLNSSWYNQTASPMLIDNCTLYNQTILNFSMVDEESLIPMNGTIEVVANIYTLGTTNLVASYNYSFNHTVLNTTRICLGNINSSYKLAYSVKHYSGTSYFAKYRNAQSITISNDTGSQNIKLYNLLAASGNTFRLVIVGNLYSSNSGLLIDVQRQYIPTNSFNTVESPVTASNGEAIAHLVTSSVVYNFIVSLNGVTIGTFNNYQVQCQNPISEQCYINLNLAQSTASLPDFTNYGNVSTVYLLDNNASTLYLTFLSTDGLNHNITQYVYQNDAFGNNTICSSTSYGTSGTLTCVIPAVYQNTTFYSESYSDGTYLGVAFFSLGGKPNYYGVDVIIELLLYSCLVMMMLSNPVLIVIGAILGVLFSIILLFISSGSSVAIISSVIFFIAAGVIIIWQIGRRL